MIVDLLNKHLPLELSAHVRYSGHAMLLKFHGYTKLAAKYEEEAAEELGHANKIIWRIKQLDGVPEYMGPTSGKVVKKCDVKEILTTDLATEEAVLESLTAVNNAAEGRETDYETSNLMRELIHDTEDHVTWLTVQLELIEDLGLQNYLQAQL